MKPQSKSREVQLSTKAFLAGKITFKQLIMSISKGYRRCFLSGALSTQTQRNPYRVGRHRGFNKYRYELYKQGQKISHKVLQELF